MLNRSKKVSVDARMGFAEAGAMSRLWDRRLRECGSQV
jgi:hypothetical protein